MLAGELMFRNESTKAASKKEMMDEVSLGVPQGAG
jgi:hypothetical protein